MQVPQSSNMNTASLPEACSVERALAIVHVRSPLNDSVRYCSEASACEQSRAFALLNRPQVILIEEHDTEIKTEVHHFGDCSVLQRKLNISFSAKTA
jgi:hypothetical protein